MCGFGNKRGLGRESQPPPPSALNLWIATCWRQWKSAGISCRSTMSLRSSIISPLSNTWQPEPEIRRRGERWRQTRTRGDQRRWGETEGGIDYKSDLASADNRRTASGRLTVYGAVASAPWRLSMLRHVLYTLWCCLKHVNLWSSYGTWLDPPRRHCFRRMAQYCRYYSEEDLPTFYQIFISIFYEQNITGCAVAPALC